VSLKWAPAQQRGGGAVRRGWLSRAPLHVRGAVKGLVSLYPSFDSDCR